MFLAIEAWHNMTILNRLINVGSWPHIVILVLIGWLVPLIPVVVMAAGWHAGHPGYYT